MRILLIFFAFCALCLAQNDFFSDLNASLPSTTEVKSSPNTEEVKNLENSKQSVKISTH